MVESKSRYRAPLWLPGGNLQTLYPALLAPRPRIPWRRERWETPDADFIDLDWTAAPVAADAPLFILFHGLEGSSRSHYARALMRDVVQRGWQGVVVHFRGCGGELNRLPRAYHSGDSAEVDWVLRRMQVQHLDRTRFVAGVSLGGNALLKWLGEQGDAAHAVVHRAAAISAPVDLHAAGDALERGFNMLYTKNFLSSLKHISRARLLRHPGLFNEQKMLIARTLREFDDRVTAPLHGFRGVDDYYTRASSKPWLRHIAVPTLLINARNDPFLPGTALPVPHELSASITAAFPDEGGHVGFPGNTGTCSWLPPEILGFCSGQ